MDTISGSLYSDMFGKSNNGKRSFGIYPTNDCYMDEKNNECYRITNWSYLAIRVFATFIRCLLDRLFNQVFFTTSMVVYNNWYRIRGSIMLIDTIYHELQYSFCAYLYNLFFIWSDRRNCFTNYGIFSRHKACIIIRKRLCNC